MELWIRSQDKSSIVKVDNLYVSVGNYICYYVEKGKEVLGTYYRPSGELGRYKTRKRALEVLDEIHKCIIDKEVLDGCNNILTLANNKSQNEIKEILARAEKIAVYEMPEN